MLYSWLPSWLFRLLISVFGDIGLGLIITLGFILVFRVLMSGFIVNRAETIVIAKGYYIDDLKLNRMVYPVAIFLGVIIGFIVCFWFVSALPTVNATNEIYTDEDESEAVDDAEDEEEVGDSQTEGEDVDEDRINLTLDE